MRTKLLKASANAFAYVHQRITTALLDLRFGWLLSGAKPTRYSKSGAYATANSSYETVRKLFRGRVRPSDVLVDVGCGKGRVINAWLRDGYANHMIGVELDSEVAAETRARLRRFANVAIVSGDVLAKFPGDGTLFYLFNPFDARVMHEFKERLKSALLHRGPAEATVIYNNCRHLEVFSGDRACEIERGKLDHEFAVIHFCTSRLPGVLR